MLKSQRIQVTQRTHAHARLQLGHEPKARLKEICIKSQIFEDPRAKVHEGIPRR